MGLIEINFLQFTLMENHLFLMSIINIMAFQSQNKDLSKCLLENQ